MSSWLSLSLPNPFKSSDDDQSSPQPQHPPTPPSHDPHSPAGVQQDLSVLTQTIGRQFRGVAAFLAPPPAPPPPPPPPPPPHSDDSSPSSSQTFLGIKNDLVEIGDSFKTSLSLLSSNKAVTEISRFASNLLYFENQSDVVEGNEKEFKEAVGITEEVVDFVGEISLRPECWTDFPLSLDKDFDTSDVQKDHAATIEQLVPSFTALRHTIKGCMSEGQFWMIYFILLLPRLNEDDSKLLSTPKIVEVREVLLQKLRNKKNAVVEISEEPETRSSSHKGSTVDSTQRVKNPSKVTEYLAENVGATLSIETRDYENSELRLVEEHDDPCTSEDTCKQTENEDDVSFSDLDDDDNDLSGRLSVVRRAESNKVSSRSESNNWVRLDENPVTLGGQQEVGQSTSLERHSEGEESNDWLTVDDIDLELDS